MLDTEIRPPVDARAYASRRRVRLSDMDAAGRVRLDAVARFLQDAAIDDVEETGWGIPEHVWVIRKIRVDVIAPLLRDRSVEIATWGSGVAAIAAGRRWSVAGNAGGRPRSTASGFTSAPISGRRGSATSGRCPRCRRPRRLDQAGPSRPAG